MPDYRLPSLLKRKKKVQLGFGKVEKKVQLKKRKSQKFCATGLTVCVDGTVPDPRNFLTVCVDGTIPKELIKNKQYRIYKK